MVSQLKLPPYEKSNRQGSPPHKDPSGQRPPSTETHPPGRNMELSSQTGSDIIQRPPHPCGKNHKHVQNHYLARNFICVRKN